MNKKKIILLLVLVISIVICIVIAKNINLKDNNVISGDENSNVNIQMSGENNQIQQLSGQNKGVAIPGWASITIPPEEKNVTINFMNPKENTGLYYLTFELRIPANTDQGYEVLYKSDLIAPGEHIDKVELSRGLDIGEYQATMHVQPYRMEEEKTPTNNADIKTRLIVR